MMSCPGQDRTTPLQFQNKMEIRLTNIAPAEFMALLPAPSVRDDFGPPAVPTNKGLSDGPLKITSSYRGHSLYLENGAFVYRDDPRGVCANGFAAASDEPETCYVRYKGQSLSATIEFV